MKTAWRFQPRETLDAAFRRTALEEIAAVRNALQTADADRETAIHEARRSFKRLRALLRLASPGMEPGFDKENRRLRDAGRLLAPARDAAVLIASFDRFVEQFGEGLEPLAPLRDLLQPKRASNGAHAEAVETHLRRAAGLVQRSERSFARLPWPAEPQALQRGFRKAETRLKASFRAARDSGEAEDLHDWRKRLKDQISQVELLRAVLPEGVKTSRKHAKDIAALLGEEHDLCLLAARLAAGRLPAKARATRDALTERIDARREKLRKRAFRLGEAAAADDLSHDLAAAWQARAAAA